MRLTILLLVLFSVSSASALDANEAGDLSIIAFVSPDLKFVKEWNATPPEHGPRIARIDQAKPNQRVHVGFAVTGYSFSSLHTVDLEVDVDVVDPNGVVLFAKNAVAACKGLTGSRCFVLAEPPLDVLIEPTDPMGRYMIRAVVRDLVGGKRATAETSLEIVP